MFTTLLVKWIRLVKSKMKISLALTKLMTKLFILTSASNTVRDTPALEILF